MTHDKHVIQCQHLLLSHNPHFDIFVLASGATIGIIPQFSRDFWNYYNYGHLLVITALFLWDYTFCKWCFLSTYNW